MTEEASNPLYINGTWATGKLISLAPYLTAQVKINYTKYIYIYIKIQAIKQFCCEPKTDLRSKSKFKIKAKYECIFIRSLKRQSISKAMAEIKKRMFRVNNPEI